MKKENELRYGCLLLGCALLLTACEQASVPKSGNAGGTRADSSAETDAAADVTRYTCVDGSIVEARYPTVDTAQLLLKGQSVDMRIAVSASGARYVGGGWEWWTKGATEGTLSPLKPGEDIASAAGAICTAP